MTFCCNADSEIALVLLLDVPGHLGGRREVVLRDWGQEVSARAGGGGVEDTSRQYHSRQIR